MSGRWTAGVTNNPDDDYSLSIELSEADRSRGRIYRDPAGQLRLTIYENAEQTDIDVSWLLELVKQSAI